MWEYQIQYVYDGGFERQSSIPINLSDFLYKNLGHVLSRNWQRGLGKYSFFYITLVCNEWMWLTEGEYWTEYVGFLCVHTLHLSQLVRDCQRLPRSICDQTPAEIKNTWEQFFNSLIASLNSNFPPQVSCCVFSNLTPSRVEPFTQNRQNQSTSNFPLEKEKKQQKQRMGERRRKTWNNVCMQWLEGDHGASCVMVGRPWSAWSTVHGEQGNMLPHTVVTRLHVWISGESLCYNFHVKVTELCLNCADEKV